MGEYQTARVGGTGEYTGQTPGMKRGSPVLNEETCEVSVPQARPDAGYPFVPGSGANLPGCLGRPARRSPAPGGRPGWYAGSDHDAADYPAIADYPAGLLFKLRPDAGRSAPRCHTGPGRGTAEWRRRRESSGKTAFARGRSGVQHGGKRGGSAPVAQGQVRTLVQSVD